VAPIIAVFGTLPPANLEKASHKVAETMYQGAGAKADPQQAPPPGGEKPKGEAKGKGDDVIDAEYEVKE
jgi:hypothetical protein